MSDAKIFNANAVLNGARNKHEDVIVIGITGIETIVYTSLPHNEVIPKLTEVFSTEGESDAPKSD